MSTSDPARTNGTLTKQNIEELRLADIVHFARRWKLLFLAGALLGLACGAFLYLRAPRLYTAVTTVELNKDSSSGLGIQDLSGIASTIGAGAEFQTDMMTDQVVLANDQTALTVISDLNLMSEHPYSDIPEGKLHAVYLREQGMPLELASFTRERALAIFRGGLRINIVKNTRLMAVSYTDVDGVRATKIANAIIQAYLRNHTEARYQATSRASEWLTQQLQGLKKKVEDNHKKVSSFQQSTGVMSSDAPTSAKTGGAGFAPDESRSTAAQRLMALNAELSRAEVARIQREAVYRLTATTRSDVILDAAGTSLADNADNMEGSVLAINARNVQLLQSLREQKSALEVRLAADRVKLGPQYPSVLALQKEIDTLSAQAQDEARRINGQAKADYLLAKANEDAIRKSVDEQQQAVFALGSSLSALSFLQQEENTSRGLYQDLYTRLEEANIAAGVKSTDMEVVDPARTPSHTSSPVLRTSLAGGLGAGLTLAVLLALILHLRDHSLRTPEEFEAIWHVPLLGLVAKFDSSKSAKGSQKGQAASPLQEQAWILNAPKSQVSEAYRKIRTSILLSMADSPKVILFTSALSGEGKSTTSYNLAIAFAVQSARVLLIDADMRRPTIKHKTGLGGKAGLSDLLAKNLPVEEVIQHHPTIENLSIIVAGTIPPTPAELLGSVQFRDLITRFRSEYDFIFIDTPPVLLVTDPLLIAGSADGIVVVTRAGATTRHVLTALGSALSKPNLRVFGYILNGMDATQSGYGYGYGYGYGSNAYYEENETK